MFRGKSVVAVIFAGGVGKRMRSKDLPKQFLVIHGTPILVRTIQVFNQIDAIDQIIVVSHPHWSDYSQQLVREFSLSKVSAVVDGGATGQESIYNGLSKASQFTDPSQTIVLIHDGVRPLIDSATIMRNIETVAQYRTAITCVPSKETILLNDETTTIIPREKALLARAPQSFILSDILQAHKLAIKDNRLDFIDSATLMKAYGHSLHLIEGSYSNIKITTQDDYFSLRAILDSQENSQLWNE